jgi:hypothetical protein
MKKVPFYAKVGKFNIPIVNWRFPTIATFKSGQHGKRERGDFFFWTAVIKNRKYPKNRIIGRAYALHNPGDRFDRMNKERLHASSKGDRKAYQKMWDVIGGGKNLKHIRPATKKEVKRWADSHKSDAKYISRLSIAGKVVKL